MNKNLIVVFLLLCASFSMGCLEEEQTSVEESVEELTINETESIPEPEITIKSVNVNRNNIIMKIVNEGNYPVDNLMVGIVTVKMVASEHYRFYRSDFEGFDIAMYGNSDDLFMLLNGTLKYSKTSYEDDDFSGEIDLPWYIHIETKLYQDYVGTLEPNEMYETTSIQVVCTEDASILDFTDKIYTYVKVVWSDNDGNITIHSIW